MKYPIDTEKYIAAMRLEFGQDAFMEEVHRDTIIPFINNCYADGLHGDYRFPLDQEEELQKFAERIGEPLEIIQKNPMLSPLIAWANRAYEQGRCDAKAVAV